MKDTQLLDQDSNQPAPLSLQLGITPDELMELRNDWRDMYGAEAIFPQPVVGPQGQQIFITVGAIDIGYACGVDWERGKIELPENLPGGVEVCVNGFSIFTTPIPLEDRSQHVIAQARKNRIRPSILSVAIRSALIEMSEAR